MDENERKKGMNQGIWLAVQELAHAGRWTQAAEELVSSCGLTEDECRKLQEESESFNDEMIKFIDNMFGRENMISEGSTISENDTICINIKYHKIGEVFNYKVGMSEMTLRVDECEMLLDKNGSDDKMESFIIQMVFNKDDKIILDDIGYHKIGSIFKYNIDSKEVELEVVESSDASCEGCAFNNSKNYYCKDTHCIDVDRKDDIDVIYKKVKRS